MRVTDSQVYALKKVRMLDLSEGEKENALNEVRILASIRSNNIIAYKEAFVDDPSQSLWYSLHNS
jgi:NIMA (never in mitosis gene a)-related kinase